MSKKLSFSAKNPCVFYIEKSFMHALTKCIYHNVCSPHRRRRPQRVSARFTPEPGPFPARNSEIHPDNFYATAWLCMEVNGARFRAYVGIKPGFPAQNSRNNGERARSLLCGREALAKPAGAAEEP